MGGIGGGWLDDSPACPPSASRPDNGGACQVWLIAIARPIWLLDEPTSGLDASGQATGDLMRAHAGGLILAAHGPSGSTGRQVAVGREPMTALAALLLLDMHSPSASAAGR